MQSSEPSRTGNLAHSNGQPSGGPNAADRDRLADERDSQARLRDERADERDLTATQAERTADPIELRQEADATLIRTWARERALAASNRERAAHDRAGAAADRRRAAEDREQAARDREQASRDLVAQDTDELTGARRRDPGLAELKREAERSRRTGEPLSIAFVDIDGLKAVNDRKGHLAGDALLRSTAAALRSAFRSYDLIVRFGGDEFLCVFPGLTASGAKKRFADALEIVAKKTPPRSLTVGFAELVPAETAENLIRRADAELLATRRLRLAAAG